MKLNAKSVAGFQATEQRQELRDEGYPLWLIVQPSGEKSWHWKGKVDGAFRRVVLGKWTDMTLAQARDAALETKSKARKGEIASPKRVSQSIPSAIGMTVNAAWLLYHADEVEGKLDTANAKMRFYQNDIAPKIGHRIITTLTHEDCDDIIQSKYDAIRKANGNGVGSNRLRSTLNRFLKWCRQEGRSKTGLTFDPMADVVKRVKREKPRDRFLSDKEIRWFLQGVKDMKSTRWNDKSDDYSRAYECLLRMVARRSEVLEMEWRWIDGDILNIPDTKNDEPQKLWLHPTVLRLIGDKPADAKPSDRVFNMHPHANTKSTNRLRASMQRIAAQEGETVDHWVLHSLRATAVTKMGDFYDQNGNPLVSDHISTLLLGQKDTTVRGKHYNKNKHFPGKKAALKLWGDWLDEQEKSLA